MQKRNLIAAVILLWTALPGNGADRPAADLVGHDLRLSAASMTSFKTGDHRQLVVLEGNARVVFGNYAFSSDKAVLHLDPVRTEYGGRQLLQYTAVVYLTGAASIARDDRARAVQISVTPVAGRDALVARFDVTGRVFADVASAIVADPRGTAVYQEALAAMESQAAAPAPERPDARPSEDMPQAEQRPSLIESLIGMTPQDDQITEQEFRYPVNITGIGGSAPQIEYAIDPEGRRIATIIGRFYIWQRLDDRGH
ncbi:MAG TPA: hypothetical protein VLH60_03170, partial [Sedimentisphaerales bacterium]|nr:hypothetical protein [Sedimentisphaerales bacterium]